MNSNVNPLFFVLEEWCFAIQSFLQSIGMVIVFLGLLDFSIFINLIYTPIHFLNLIIFIFWLPLIICLLAARYTDIYQLVPICTQLIFLMSPILYPERNLGKLSFLANLNPAYKILALFIIIFLTKYASWRAIISENSLAEVKCFIQIKAI